MIGEVLVPIQGSSAFNETIVRKLVQGLAFWSSLSLSFTVFKMRVKNPVLSISPDKFLGNVVSEYIEHFLRTFHITCPTNVIDCY